MLPIEIQKDLIHILQQKTGLVPNLTDVRPVGGGCINDAHWVKTNLGDYFVKYNLTDRFPGMFEAEAQGLGILEKAGVLRVPIVIGYGNTGNHAFLVLEYLNSASREKNFWEHFGKGLAKLHRKTFNVFGLDHNNYIGSLPQKNQNCKQWKDFFITQRIEPQLRLALRSGKADDNLQKKFERLFTRLEDFFPEEPPALLHGDLWSGNYLTGPEGKAVIIDPAVYYGHRYMDLGMTRLFGGFDNSFYSAYQEEYPLDNRWQEGLEIANLYPLMVHVNLFGGSYLASVHQILRRYS